MRNNLLCKAREDRGWTQEELAERMRVSKATIKSWESGRRFPSLALRARLCEVFEMTAAQLGLEQNSTQQPSQEEAQTVTKLPEQDPNRRRMLKRVQTRWISGVLDHSLSLYQGTLIRVGLQECPSAIINPWSKVAQESNLPPRSLSPETRITDVYDEADGGLLILGEPGSGKTTLLLELARDLIARASLDEKHPIPVVFNLTSWAEKRSELPIWLVDELQVKYQVPRKLAQEWVSEDRILPLLDGLDEVAETYHAPCVQAINVYRSEHGFVSLVICSRASEYFALDTRLALNNAVTIEPLTIEQIESYVSVAGENLQRVQVALQSDPGLQEMASTPLMLNIMAQTFSATSIEDILPVQDKVSQRAMIFEKYVDIVLRHRGPANRYLSEQTIYGLSWLARQMQKHNQTEFYLERVQPDWLPDDSTRVRYRNTIIRLVFGLNHVVIAALFALFRGDSVPNKPGLFSWLGAGGKGNELLEWMRPGLAVGLAGASSLDLLMVVLASLIVLLINQGEIPTLSLKTVQVGLLHGLRNGLLVGGPVALTSGIIFALSKGPAKN
jgi:transcriptional regulator with XRE-family HTH domain/DNA polymerase III delta prime subunit